MLIIIIILGLFLIGIGYLVTENNAKYLLAGYNTMSEEERKKVNLERYIPFFKKFHLFLGISFIILGSLLNFISENAAGIFMGIYPIVAYIYFIWKSNNLSNGKNSKNKWAIGMLVACLILVIGLMFTGFQEDKIIVTSDEIKIEGMYGETIKLQDIETVNITEKLPKINWKTNGFALGDINKGYFKTENGEKIKLIINAKNSPYLSFLKKNGEKIYFSAKNTSNEEIFQNILQKQSLLSK